MPGSHLPRDLTKLSDQALKTLIEKAMLDSASIVAAGVDVAPRPKSPLSTEAMQPLLNEARRRGIPLASLAEFIVQRGVAGRSALGRVLAPPRWRDFEIRAASAIVAVLRNDGISPDEVTFDAKVKGALTSRIRQVDLMLVRHSPLHIVACEFRHHSKALAITSVEAFAGKLEDIGASKGVMVTGAGSQAGARAAANGHGIVLFSLREFAPDVVRERFPERSSEIKEGTKYWLLEHEGQTWVFSDTSDPSAANSPREHGAA